MRMMGVLLQCKKLLQRSWEVCFQHVFCEAIVVADRLVNLAVDLDLGVHVFQRPPTEVSDLLQADMQDVARIQLEL
ncbi:hypothetical protein GH714_026225 [Hevea brasiliensis]|uniref:RNase H type-1 domain-containing protein n=1 Tax=Hevea brasiliensis TaxID=3981 RepID=A0A6A6LJD7_HEVBR|nr:hypothetical protein GH714_026225 [Hevea brasiliensis]